MATNRELAGEEALKLASQFRAASIAVGDHLYGNWARIPAGDRVALQGLEITLLNLATDLVSQAVDALIDAGQASITQLGFATNLATDAIARISDSKSVIRVATALIGLAASIPTGNWAGILPAVELLEETAEKAKKQD